MKANSDHDPDLTAMDGDDLRPTVFDWTRQGNRADEFLRTLDTRLQHRRRRRWAMGIASSTALMAVAVIWFSEHSIAGFGNPATAAASVYANYKADFAKPLQKILQDGSVLDLNVGADCAVDFSGATRRVMLHAGIAHFEVAKAAKPFVVVAGGVEVRAVGTAFAVQLSGKGEVEVIVTEGTIAVDDPSRGNSAHGIDLAQKAPDVSGQPGELHVPARSPTTVALVEAGHYVIVPAGNISLSIDDRIAAISAAEIARRLSWINPRVAFDATPLADAIVMINRTSIVKLRLGDEAAGQVKVSGGMRANNLEPLLNVLESHYGLIVERNGDTVTIRKAPATPTP